MFHLAIVSTQQEEGGGKTEHGREAAVIAEGEESFDQDQNEDQIFSVGPLQKLLPREARLCYFSEPECGDNDSSSIFVAETWAFKTMSACGMIFVMKS